MIAKDDQSREERVSRILIVDDEEAILFAFSKVLGGPNFELHTAQTLDDALPLLHKNSYQAVIADLKLSGTSNNEGFQVIESARESQKGCKIIVMTAYGDEKTKEKVSSLGADCYLEKPVFPRRVKEILAAMGIG
jgi:DNA-binding response OmpR family regulator